MPKFLRSSAREPLAQFAAIGVLLFALDAATSPARENPRQIVMNEAVYAELVQLFAATNGRAPTPEEMTPLADRWALNEVMYREAKALGLDRGDEMVRERLLHKLNLMMHGQVEVAPPDEATARAWFDENRDLYDRPEMLSFALARLDATEAEAAARTEAANAPGGDGGETALGARILRYADRPRPAVAQVFGPEFMASLDALALGTWTPIPSPTGWQALRLEARTPGRPAEFDEVKGAVMAAWREERYRNAVRDAIAALQASYDVTRMPYDPAAFADLAAAPRARFEP